MKTNTWTTARGAKVVLITKHITEEEVNLDGHVITVETNEIAIVKFTVDGKEMSAVKTVNKGEEVLELGIKTINGKKVAAQAILPANVYENVWGEYDRQEMAKLEKALEADRKYQANYNKVMSAMNQ